MKSDLTRDWLELIEILLDEGVAFLVVGAHALSLYGYKRHTEDFDIFVGTDSSNAAKVLKALNKFFGSNVGFRVEQFTTPDKVVVIGEPPFAVDILTTIEGVEFDQAYQNRTEEQLGGYKVPVIGLEDLLKNKRSTGRAKDLSDVAELEKRLQSKGLEIKR